MLSVCAIPATLFLCGLSRAKGGGGKESSPGQDMVDRSAAAASKATTGCQEAPTPETAFRSAATATGGGVDPGRDRCAGCPLCVPSGGPGDGGLGAAGGDCCCCDCGGCHCGAVDCSGCGAVDCSGVDCIFACCGACLMMMPFPSC